MSISDKLIEIAEGIPEVYEAGKVVGIQEYYSEFWGNYLQHDGSHMFAGKGWNDETFNPPPGTVIQPTNPYMMFSGSYITDLVELCRERNIVIDFSKATSSQYLFHSGCKITHVGEVNTTKMTNISNMIVGAYALHTIDNLILKEDGSQKFTTPIESCNALANLTISGKIGQDGMRLNSCPLTNESLRSVITALYDYSGTTTTRTITLGTNNINNLTEAEKAIATQKGWSLV